ncbi:MAG: hypothetical protein H0T73_00835 [Ardenticatenales bacterium]|nr:hypothetical protein [Ardenticatenales bacterium]
MTEANGGYHPEQAFTVLLSEEGVACRRSDGFVESVLWAELRAVLLETNDQGPFAMDVWWILVGEQGGCVIPQGAVGEEALLARLQALTGFDNQAVIDAMLSTENQRFLCWERQP